MDRGRSLGAGVRVSTRHGGNKREGAPLRRHAPRHRQTVHPRPAPPRPAPTQTFHTRVVSSASARPPMAPSQRLARYVASAAALPPVSSSLRLACLPGCRGRGRSALAVDGLLSAGVLRFAASTPRAAPASRPAPVWAVGFGASQQPSSPDRATVSLCVRQLCAVASLL
jgi:hypothetical protein